MVPLYSGIRLGFYPTTISLFCDFLYKGILGPWPAKLYSHVEALKF